MVTKTLLLVLVAAVVLAAPLLGGCSIFSPKPDDGLSPLDRRLAEQRTRERDQVLQDAQHNKVELKHNKR